MALAILLLLSPVSIQGEPDLDPSSAVSFLWSGGVTSNSARVKAKLMIDSTIASLAVCEQSDFSTGVIFSTFDTSIFASNNGVVTFEIGGLTSNRQYGINQIAVPTAGNAGGALAAYAARAGIKAYVFMPEDTPIINQQECDMLGAATFLVNGLITDCGKIVREGKETMGWFDFSTLREPYRIEGKKTMGLELAEQFDWNLPDVILYPTGGGTGLIGMWKAFAELETIGWLNSSNRPRMVAVQSDGCCPIVRAYDAGERFAKPFPDAKTAASGLRVPAAVGDFMILDAVRESEGQAIAVDEDRLREWLRLASSLEGISICPETAACVGALERLTDEGWIKPEERVVIFNTGAAQKYPEFLSAQLPLIDTTKPIDWEMIARSCPAK